MLAIILGLPAAVLIAYVLLIPFEVQEDLINRRTGQEHYRVVVYGILKEEGAMREVIPNLHEYGALTMPDTKLLRYTLTRRFPWSPQAGKIEEPGNSIYQLFNDMFSFQFHFQLRIRPVPKETIDRLMKERVGVWNTQQIDDETIQLRTFYVSENKDVLPPPPQRKSQTAAPP